MNRLNTTGRIVTLIAGLIIVGMLLFPPWQRTGAGGRVWSTSYRFLFSKGDEIVNVSRLTIQVLAVGALGGLIVALFGLRSREIDSE